MEHVHLHYYECDKERGRIVPQGVGGFLNPPGDPEHCYSVETDLRRKPENRGRMSLRSAVECQWLQSDVRQEAAQMLQEAKENRLPLNAPEVRSWVSQVLGYFRNCYSPDGEQWNASELVIDSKRDPMANADRHAGVRWVRKFYPDFTPSREDFDFAQWGG